MDPVGLSVLERVDLDAWAARLDALRVSHSGVTDMGEPIPYAALVFRDPDNIQLEFVHLPSLFGVSLTGSPPRRLNAAWPPGAAMPASAHIPRDQRLATRGWRDGAFSSRPPVHDGV
jgi:hypothetical protein